MSTKTTTIMITMMRMITTSNMTIKNRRGTDEVRGLTDDDDPGITSVYGQMGIVWNIIGRWWL